MPSQLRDVPGAATNVMAINENRQSVLAAFNILEQ